jgi:hypothetical protein
MVEDREIEVLHPVPVRWAPRPDGEERLWFAHLRTPVTLRRIPAGTMRPVAVPGSPVVDAVDVHAFEGRAWRRFDTLTEDYTPGGAATVEEAVAILGGGGPPYNARRAHPAGSPLTAPDSISPPSSRQVAEPDARVLAKAAEDLSDAARSRVRAFFETEACHDGEAFFVRVPPPVPHAFCRTDASRIHVSIPETSYGWSGPGAAGVDLSAYLDLVEGLSGHERACEAGAAADALRPFDALRHADDAVDAFLSQAPHFLWRSWASLRRNHAPVPGSEDLVPAGEAALARLRPFAARSGVGLLDRADRQEAAEAVHAVARILAGLYPSHGLRSRFDETTGFVGLVIRPRLGAGSPASEDDGILAALAP